MQDTISQRELLAQHIRAVRRVTWVDVFLNIFGRMGMLDLTFTQFAALLLLDAGGEGQMKDLAARLQRSLAATSRLVDGLVQRGLIERREDPSDRRSRRVRLTQAGRELLGALEQARVEAQLRAMESLSAEEQAIVMQGMRLMAEAVSRRSPDGQAQRSEDQGSQVAGAGDGPEAGA